LPIAYTILPTQGVVSTLDHAYLGLNVVDSDNVNLTLAQKELVMLWHFKLGHFHLEWIQKLFRI
jgi:hypothetical protein